MSIDPSSGSLWAEWSIALVRTASTRRSVTLLLNDALSISRLSGTGVTDYRVENPPDRESDRNRVTIRFAPRADGDSVTRLNIEYAGAFRTTGDSINSIRGDWVELGLDSFWHPVVEGFAQPMTARVRLSLPANWTVVTSGVVTDSGDVFVLVNDVPLVDIAFAASPSLRYTVGNRSRVYHVDGDPAVIDRVLATTDRCAEYLDARFGSRAPLPSVKVVLAPRDGPGYARKNYVVIAGIVDTATVPLARFVCHEVAHYWSSGAVSSGPENWLNEAFAEFVSARYVRASVDDSAYAGIVRQWREQGADQPPVWSPGSTTRPNARTAYRKAPFLLHRLEERVGTAVMDQILERFMVEGMRTTPAVLEMIGQVAGPEAADWFEEQLRT
ncbi:MAG TPA: hypothetical protein VJ803_08815 [Gemmatimonadaceae bacterium]|nr:hypothetical protein [Gemmatimonadaceae bacterium]